jgi:hypothetical protein
MGKSSIAMMRMVSFDGELPSVSSRLNLEDTQDLANDSRRMGRGCKKGERYVNKS